VRLLKHRYPCGRQVRTGLIDIVGPHDQDHGRAAGCGLDAVHPLGRLDRTEADHELVEAQFDMLGDALGRGPERLGEPEKIAVEVQSGFDVARVEIHKTSDKHGQQI